MVCLRPATRPIVSCKRYTQRCASQHHVRYGATLAPRDHNEGLHLDPLVAIPLPLPQNVIHIGYAGFGKNDAKTAQDLLNRLSLSPRNVQSKTGVSRAYDPTNTFPDKYVTPASRVGSEYFKTMEELRHIEAQALSLGREIARRSKDKYVLRRTFRRLFDQCDTCHDFNRILALATQKSYTLEALQHLVHPIVKAMYRAREYAEDKRIYSCLYTVIIKLEKANLQVDVVLYSTCAKFAARSRDPVALQRALHLFRKNNIEMGFRTFRAIVAKFSIGTNGYGEIRNGRWQRSDLIPCIIGFPGTISRGGTEPDHHLGSFLRRDQWGYLTAWIQILAHCQLSEEVWHEWMYYRDSIMRKRMHRKARDEFFIAQMLVAGDAGKAWKMLYESGLDFWTVGVNIRTKLHEEMEHVGFMAEAMADREGFVDVMRGKFEYGKAIWGNVGEVVEQREDG